MGTNVVALEMERLQAGQVAEGVGVDDVDVRVLDVQLVQVGQRAQRRRRQEAQLAVVLAHADHQQVQIGLARSCCRHKKSVKNRFKSRPAKAIWSRAKASNKLQRKNPSNDKKTIN